MYAPYSTPYPAYLNIPPLPDTQDDSPDTSIRGSAQGPSRAQGIKAASDNDKPQCKVPGCGKEMIRYGTLGSYFYLCPDDSKSSHNLFLNTNYPKATIPERRS